MISLDDILRESVRKGATYVYLKDGISPMFRIAERLQSSEFDPINKDEIEELLKGLMTTKQEARLEADHDITIKFPITELGMFHVNILRTENTYCLASKHVSYQIPDVSALNLPAAFEKELLKSIKGLILVSGLTRSGKSTTLAAFIDWINRNRSEHILTIENPTEYLHNHRKSIVSQIELCENEVYASAIRRARRQSPDVIQLCVLENKEDIEEAILAAESGILVLASLNASSAVQTIDRIVDKYPETQQQQIRVRLSNCLVAILYQALVVRRPADLTSTLQPCFQKQLAACELLINTPAISNLIREAKTAQIYSAIQMGSHFGMQTIESALAQLVKSGLVNHQDAISKTSRPDDLNSFFDPKGPDDDPPAAVALRRPS